jgi:hypothetical protein
MLFINSCDNTYIIYMIVSPIVINYKNANNKIPTYAVKNIFFEIKQH